MLKNRVVGAFLAVAVIPALTIGLAGSAHAGTGISWKNGAQDQCCFLGAQSTGGGVLVSGYGQRWTDVQNSDGSWNEVDVYGRCLTGYGSQAYTENCNSGPDGTNPFERWREIWTGSGFKLQNVQSGGFLDWTGSLDFGSVYVNGTDYNNQNQRWY